MLFDALLRMKFLLKRRRSEEVDEELNFHLEQSVQMNISRGMTAADARRQAMIAFGGLECTRARCHEQKPGWLLETVIVDIRYAIRGFRHNLAFTATATVTLALAIGATTAVFSVVDRILFRSLPYAQDGQIVSVGLVQSLERQEFMLGGFFFDWRDHQNAFSAMASQGTYARACDLIETNPEQVGCLRVQAGFLPLLA